MTVRRRAYCSFTIVAIVSIVTKLWATSITENESSILKMIQMAETARTKAERDQSKNHIAYALGLCEGARLVTSDSEIERITGIHIQTYTEKLNALLCQYGRYRREKKKGEKA